MKIKGWVLYLICFFIFYLGLCLRFANAEENKHPIYSDILKLRPSIDKLFARKLSNSLHKYVKLQGLDVKRALAIIMQESSFRRRNTFNGGKLTDVGIFQFHVMSIKAYNLELSRLSSHDIDYSVQSYVKVMRDKLRICRLLGDEAWSCYHSTTPAIRKIYVNKVNRFYKRVINEE